MDYRPVAAANVGLAFEQDRDEGLAVERQRERIVLEGWSHYDLYDKHEPVGQALD